MFHIQTRPQLYNLKYIRYIMKSWWIYVIYLPISFRVTSLALGHSHDCPSAREVNLKDMGKERFVIYNHKKTQQNINCVLIFGMYIIPCIYYISISYPDHRSIIYKVLYFNLQRAPIQEASNEHTYQCNPVLLVQAYKSGTTLQTMLILDQTLPCYPAV